MYTDLNNSKKIWRTLKSLGMNSKNVNQWKICLKEDGVTQFEPKKNANIFKTFYSELAGNLVKMLPKPPLQFNTDKNMMFCKKLNPNLEKFELACITEETIEDTYREKATLQYSIYQGKLIIL